MSGRQDSNLRPSAPKADAITELRYAPIKLQEKNADGGGFEPPVQLSHTAV